jgi:hypothetical protein
VQHEPNPLATLRPRLCALSVILLALGVVAWPALGQTGVTRIAHPGGLTVLDVETPTILSYRETDADGNVTITYWQHPGGRFQLRTGPTVPVGGDPTYTGDEDRPVASLATAAVKDTNFPYTVFSSKVTLAVGGDNETGNYFDPHALAVNADTVTGATPVWDFWPVPMVAGSRDIVGTAQVPLDDEDPNVALEFVDIQHHYTLLGDTLQIEYVVTNKTDRTLPIGLRAVIDGRFGGSSNYDGTQVYLPDGGLVGTERVIPDSGTTRLPSTWVTLDDADNPTMYLRGTLKGDQVTDPGTANESAGVPDQIGWGLMRDVGSDAQWDFTPISVLPLSGEDWAYFVRWDETDLRPGRSRRYVTYFGMGGSSSDYEAPYVFSAYAPAALVAAPGDDPATPAQEAYHFTDPAGNMPFTVYAYADNYYASPILDANVRISLPTGLELYPATQSRTKSLGTVKRNQLAYVSWTVRPVDTRPGQAVITFTGPYSKTVRRTISIPAMPVLEPLPSTNGLEMISIPYAFSNTDAEHVLQSLGYLYVGGASALARWDADEARYRYFPEAGVTNITPGYGYWLLNQNATTVYLPADAQEVPTDEPYSVDLVVGWNQIGNPFTGAVYLDDASVLDSTGIERTVSSAASRGLLLPTLFAYDPSTGEYTWESELPNVRMDPYGGYWVYCYEDLTLLIPPPTPFAPTAAPPAAATPVSRAAEGWKVALTVRGAGKTRSSRCFGEALGASAATDGNDVLAPPTSPPQGATLAAEWVGASGGERYMEDIRPNGDGRQEWCLAVTTSATNAPVTVSWPDLSQLPKDLAAVLSDRVSGQRVYMRTATSYTFPSSADGGPRELTITVAPRAAGATLVSSASVLPTGSGGASIAYTLAGDAAVDVVVCNMSGLPVREVALARSSAPGANTVAWDGRSALGVRVPAGRYLCKITARAADTGQQHSLVRSFQIAR